MLDSGMTPEEVCCDCPDLLPLVKERWRDFCQVDEALGAVFPGLRTPSGAGTIPNVAPTIGLPQIPGYTVEAILGYGGMGAVYKARQRALDRVVAVKVLLAGPFASPIELARFHRETAALACLKHPNIVQVYDAGDVEGRPYLAMELIEGGTLAKKLAVATLSARDAAVLMKTLAQAVEEAHQAGIVHRDLKPVNILLTVDGTPKITDFGLARRMEGDAGLTQTGVAIGTPSYMAPEQARGHAPVVGPAVDVYALGSILYECLTGRPPFRAETPAETVLQVISQDPVAPSRLQHRIPRDLETICLKCLEKEPRFRYATAAALADDLACFQNGQAIAARPEGPMARLVRRVRRQPAISAAVAVSALLAFALIGSGLWYISEGRATARAAEDDLRDMVQSLRNSSWLSASAARDRAQGRLDGRGPAALQRQVIQGTRDLELAGRLDAIRMKEIVSVEGVDRDDRIDGAYAEVFQKVGLGTVDDMAPTVAERITRSDIRSALVSALDHWFVSTQDSRRKVWTLEVARRADPDQSDWRVRARDPEIRKSQEAVKDLIRAAPIKDAPVSLLIGLEMSLPDPVDAHVGFLKRIHLEHPDDFWINQRLGLLMYVLRKPAESVGYCQAALAVRPDSALVHNNLGRTLTDVGRPEEGLAHYRRAAELDPSDGVYHNHVALALSALGRDDEAIPELEKALHNNPNAALLHSGLGNCLERKGRNAEAHAYHIRAVELEPKRTHCQSELRAFLQRRGQTNEMWTAWQAALSRDPPEYEAWYGYAELCLYLNQLDEYRRARTTLLQKFGATTDPKIAERTARACLLSPSAGDEFRQAVALADRALAADTAEYRDVYQYFQFVKALAEYREGQFEQAVKNLQGGASRMYGPSPQLVLAMALHQAGHQAEARKALDQAIQKHDWRPEVVRNQDDWIMHVLRREAEKLIVPVQVPLGKSK
jgi:serine/threonine-protein kinase